jgi:hypothetical protein
MGQRQNIAIERDTNIKSLERLLPIILLLLLPFLNFKMMKKKPVKVVSRQQQLSIIMIGVQKGAIGSRPLKFIVLNS